MRTLFVMAALSGLALPALAQTTSSSIAVQTGTIQVAGPRPGPNGDRFFNIEGTDTAEAFRSYGVARWDLTAARAEFDAAFGAGAWKVAALKLEMTQDNAAFSREGGIDVYYSTDDTTDCKTAASLLKYPFFDALAGTPDLALGAGAAPILKYTFVVKATGDIDAYDQAGGPGGAGEKLSLAADVIADIKRESMLTLVFVDGTAPVAATYRGQEAFPGPPPRSGPTLRITAESDGVPPACRANCNGDTDPVTGKPKLDVLDFTCFQNAFALADLSKADVGGTVSCTPDGALTISDFSCFQNLFALGCP